MLRNFTLGSAKILAYGLPFRGGGFVTERRKQRQLDRREYTSCGCLGADGRGAHDLEKWSSMKSRWTFRLQWEIISLIVGARVGDRWLGWIWAEQWGWLKVCKKQLEPPSPAPTSCSEHECSLLCLKTRGLFFGETEPESLQRGEHDRKQCLKHPAFSFL